MDKHDERRDFYDIILEHGLRAEAGDIPPETRIKLYWERAIKEMTDERRSKRSGPSR